MFHSIFSNEECYTKFDGKGVTTPFYANPLSFVCLVLQTLLPKDVLSIKVIQEVICLADTIKRWTFKASNVYIKK